MTLPTRRWLALAILLLAAPPVGALPRRSITIGIVGDQTYSSDLGRSYGVLKQGVGILSARRPDVVLHVGDLVESTASPEEVRTRFAAAAALLDRLPAPWYLAAGDHDVSPPAFAPGSADRSREALFQELYGRRVPAFREHPWYSFDLGSFHFVALYSQQALDADPRWGDIFLARIRRDQLDWLRRDLEAHRRARAVVVFLHQPLWYHWSGWKPVHDLLRRHPVAAVVAGHFHYDQDEGEIDGIRYLVVGTTGADTKSGSRDAGDAQHVTLLRVSGPGRVAVDLLPVGGGGPLPLTPREDMDRVQALDVQLGSLWDFARRNPVFLKDGRLVDACQDGGPPASGSPGSATRSTCPRRRRRLREPARRDRARRPRVRRRPVRGRGRLRPAARRADLVLQLLLGGAVQPSAAWEAGLKPVVRAPPPREQC